MFNSKQFRQLILQPTLKEMNLWSKEAEDLLCMVMAWESEGGTYLAQINGPAIGIFMMQPSTHDDIWENFLSKHTMWQDIAIFRYHDQPYEMISNLEYATAMARVFFLRIKEPIPKDLDSLSAYAKKYWNTEKGKATPEDYLQAYHKFEGIRV